MNCSRESGLRALLSRLLHELNKANVSLGALPGDDAAPPEEPRGEDAYLYILLIMIFYAVLAGGLILAYTRSRKQESKSDPYHLYIEREWARGARERAAEAQRERPPGGAECQQLL
ncbi:potassium voltage-gated channel subfamily E regulatory beta subunit 5 [Ambystoma mexicanum]|uniref:potassium voltage-gated channel subfamily E regulatory beta subunit 5 n=1 Tax=Ambystoma mexicanum TaxID=8296 RepID=UPI0037E714F9